MRAAASGWSDAAHRAVQLMIEAGVPKDVLHLLPGGGDIGAALTSDARWINGVAFTGSTLTALKFAHQWSKIATLRRC
jgi:delta 1-pyrroline-5-carboxylate dehydrogenase